MKAVYFRMHEKVPEAKYGSFVIGVYIPDKEIIFFKLNNDGCGQSKYGMMNPDSDVFDKYVGAIKEKGKNKANAVYSEDVECDSDKVDGLVKVVIEFNLANDGNRMSKKQEITQHKIESEISELLFSVRGDKD